MAYPAGLEAALVAALEEAFQTPAVQAALDEAGVAPSEVVEITVSNSTLGTEVVEVTAPE